MPTRLHDLNHTEEPCTDWLVGIHRVTTIHFVRTPTKLPRGVRIEIFQALDIPLVHVATDERLDDGLARLLASERGLFFLIRFTDVAAVFGLELVVEKTLGHVL